MDLQEQLQRAFVELGLARPGLGVEPKTTDKAISLARGAIYAAQQALAAPQPSQGAPIDMVLHCPACGMQHIDAPEELPMPMPGSAFEGSAGWTNPPHRSHLCHGCGHIWRPADVPTNGVAAVKTKGEADSQPASAEADKVEWTDNQGGRHAVTIPYAAELLKQLFDEWPDGVNEIEAALRWRDREIARLTSESVAVSGEVSERKPCPEGWAFHAADFSINATSDFTAPGNVTFTRTGRARAAWFKLTEEEQEATSLYVSGRGIDLDAAWDNGIDAVLALAGSAKQAAALERMARLDDEMGEQP